MTVDDAINQMMTCASDVYCKREEACFVVAKYAQAMRGRERTTRAIEPSNPDTIAHYAPCWDSNGIDWSAAYE